MNEPNATESRKLILIFDIPVPTPRHTPKPTTRVNRIGIRDNVDILEYTPLPVAIVAAVIVFTCRWHCLYLCIVEAHL